MGNVGKKEAGCQRARRRKSSRRKEAGELSFPLSVSFSAICEPRCGIIFTTVKRPSFAFRPRSPPLSLAPLQLAAGGRDGRGRTPCTIGRRRRASEREAEFRPLRATLCSSERAADRTPTKLIPLLPLLPRLYRVVPPLAPSCVLEVFHV